MLTLLLILFAAQVIVILAAAILRIDAWIAHNKEVV